MVVALVRPLGGDTGLAGSGVHNSSGTNLSVTWAQRVPIGTFLWIVLAFDNHASTTAATVTIPTIGGITMSSRNGAAGSGQTTTAGTGVWLRTWSGVTTTAIAAGAVFNFTFGSAVVSKSCVILGLTNVTNTARGSVTANGSTAGTPSGTTSGTLVEGDIVIGSIAGEHNAVNGDADTVSGPWSSIISATTALGTANQNVIAGVQWKQVRDASAQTFNPTLGASSDSVVGTLSLVPADVSGQWGVAA